MLKKPYRRLKDKLYNWLTDEPHSTEPMPYDFTRLKYEIRPGDVLLMKGRSRVSAVIRTITQSPWTHAALYIGRLIEFEDDEIQKLIRKHIDVKESTRLVIEDVLNQGTIISPLSNYRDQHIRICRPIGITPIDVHLVIYYMLKNLGQPYNVRQLLDLARFLLPWAILPRRWGSSLFRTSSGEAESGVCSSLIAEAFASVQFPILPFVKPNEENNLEVFHRNPYLYTPKDFDYSPYFEVIKYPLFNPDEPLPYYRRLPWTTSELLHQDGGILHGPRRKKLHVAHKNAADHVDHIESTEENKPENDATNPNQDKTPPDKKE